ncbi:MAG TPA: DNRLRE domain-containing protein [Rhodocyclaceae bacterium]|nr:DNRLRE domain-containing protein [Rhodocyclaceae bacterium]HNO88434.1 DNRLRE domain-containing protein [Rhodocyclaceae bacterium]
MVKLKLSRVCAAVGAGLGGVCAASAIAAAVPETVTLNAVADSYVDANSYNNYGKIVYFMVGSTKSAYLRFDLSSLADRDIRSATMKVRAQKPFSDTFSVMHAVDNGWNEYSLGWFNRPYNVVSAQGALSTVATTNGGWATVDVTNAVSLTQGRPLTLQISGTNTTPLWFDTRESGNTPTLTVTSVPKSVTLTPVQDSYVDPAMPDTTFAGAPSMKADPSGAEVIMRFDLSALTDRTVLGGTLHLKTPYGGPQDVQIYMPANADLQPNVLTYTTQPTLLPDPVSAPAVAEPGGVAIDVGSILKGLNVRSPLSLVIRSSGSTLGIASMETATPPTLEVLYRSVSITSTPLSSVPLKVGINIEATNYYGTEVPGIDLMKQGHTWYTQCYPWRDALCSAGKFSRSGGSSWDTLEQDVLDQDASGWVRSLPAPGDGATTGVNYTSIATLIPSSLSDRYPGGRYIVRYDGEGTFSLTNSKATVTRNTALSSPGRAVFDIVGNPATAVGSAMNLSITATDPNRTGNYLRNIRIFPPGGVCSDDVTRYCNAQTGVPACSTGAICQDFETVYPAKPFDPRFLANIKRFDTLRFMGYQSTNNAVNEAEWSDRTRPDHYTWIRTGYHLNPIENVVDLGNTLHRNIWVNVPHRASDDYIYQLATAVKNRLSGDLKVYVEYGNEIWNTMFSAGSWVEQQGLAEWPYAPDSAYVKRLQWQGKRTAETCDIWASVWGSDKSRVICVAGIQTGSAWAAGYVLDCPLYAAAHGGIPCYQHNMKAVAVAPYFGGYIGDWSHKAAVESWTLDADGGLGRLFAELFQGGQFTDSPPGGAIASALRALDTSVGLSRDRGLQTVSYEGGQHLTAVGASLQSPAIVQLLTRANRDARMGDAYKTYLAGWVGSGASLFTQWHSVGSYGVWGNWGLLEYRDQPGSPKFNAVQTFLGTVGQ